MEVEVKDWTGVIVGWDDQVVAGYAMPASTVFAAEHSTATTVGSAAGQSATKRSAKPMLEHSSMVVAILHLTVSRYLSFAGL